MDHPLVLPKKVNNKVHVVKFTTKELQSSVKKAKPFARMIIGKSYYESLYILSKYIQKVPKFLTQSLIESKEVLKNQNLNCSYIYIQGLMTNKHDRFKKKIHFKGRAKTGVIKKMKINFIILFGKRNIKDFYKDIVLGKNHSNLAQILREKLQNTNAGYEELRSFSWVLTSKGRQQQKLIVKRKALYKYLEFKRAGIEVPLKILLEKEAEIEAVKFMEKWGNLFYENQDKIDNFEERKRIFEKRTNHN